MNARHVPELDGLRGLAALAVVIFHAQTLLPGGVWATGASRWMRAGWLGVDVFFALSGYLITRGLLTLREEPHYFARFYGRRVLRIFPLYYLHLAALLAVGSLLPQRYYDPGDGDLALAAVFFGNLPDAMGHFPGAALSPLWSLAVEEHFYWLWPLVMWRRSVPRLLAVCAGAVGLALVSRWWRLRLIAHRPHVDVHPHPHAAHKRVRNETEREADDGQGDEAEADHDGVARSAQPEGSGAATGERPAVSGGHVSRASAPSVGSLLRW